MIPFKAIQTQMETILKGVKTSGASSGATNEATEPEPVVDMAEGEEQMELYAIVSGLERASDDQLRVIFGELKVNQLNRIQRVLDDMRDVPNY